MENKKKFKELRKELQLASETKRAITGAMVLLSMRNATGENKAVTNK
jgi:hypothetical protein